ncbi:TBC1 domain family member 30 [Brachionichthys hirsutus]|uniref:TBC1 domain family member 30 n=1 Tax=Brachionichthys hirsutus TaxID=412623 RepID=UPI0036048B74
MATEVKVNGNELSEVDICDRGVDSEDESGVFVNSVASHRDDFCGFQQWTSPAGTPSDTSSAPGQVFDRGAPPGTDTRRASAAADSDSESQGDGARIPRSSIVDCLLVELYETCGGGSRRNVDCWDSSTEASGSDAFLGRSNSGSSFLQELQEKHTRRHQVNYLSQKAPEALRSIVQEVKYRTGLQSAKLIRQLRRRDRLCHKLQKNYDIITACLQAVSQKRRVDTRLKFTIEPSLGKNGFQQWYDALKAVARLPTGIPKEWRKRVWLTLADRYLHSISIDWDKTLRFAFNERSNPDDDSLGIQIVKDLHRTGCSSYCGQEGEQDRVVLKRVLLAYARWNKAVGYCQGFNVLAALILEVTEGNESDALKVMIYLIDKVLPESYFANNLRALSVDMAVFRDLLRLKLPRLSQHLHHLQKAANKEAGGSYEPPLTNVFTMQWFLTMFATCLPAPTVLKIWDSVFFEGSEMLFRAALAIWERLGERIEDCQTADEFYSAMGRLTREMLEHDLVDAAELMQEVYAVAAFPFPQLAELREKYTYNITPFPTSVKSGGSGGLGGLGGWESDDDDADMDDDDAVVTALGCLGPLGGLLAPELHRYQKHLKDQRSEQGSIAELSPGAVAAGGGARAEHQAAINSMMMERMNTDIYALKKQYARIKRRQQQQSMQLCIRTGDGPPVVPIRFTLQRVFPPDKCPATRVTASQLNPSGAVINHLLLGRKPSGGGSGLPSAGKSTLSGSRLAPPSRSQGSPTRRRRGSLRSNSTGSPGSAGGGVGSPWRAHVRVHRRNVARARAQLGFGDSEEGVGSRGEEETAEETGEEEQEESGDSSAPLSPDSSTTGPVCEEAPQVAEVVVQLDSLDLEDEANPTPPDNVNPPEPRPEPQVPLLPPPPSSNGRKEHESSGLERNTDERCPTIASSEPHHALNVPPPTTSTFYRSSSPSTPSLCSASSLSTPTFPPPGALTPKQQVFSPFPSVKQPRKSSAARNLGLYGPTSRTPSVHFPQLGRNLHRSGGAGTAGRR